MAEDKDIQKQIQKGLLDINVATKDGVKSLKQQEKQSSADIKQQQKESIADIKQQQKDSVADIKQLRKESVADIKQQQKESIADIKQQQKESVADIKQQTKDLSKKIKDDISESQKKIKEDIKNEFEQQLDKVKEASEVQVEKINDTSNRELETATTAIQNETQTSVNFLKQETEKQQQTIEDFITKQTEQASSTIKNITEQSVTVFKKLVEDQKKKFEQNTLSNTNQKPNDLTTSILQNILTEIKVLRKVTEGRVSFDQKSGRYRGAGGKYVKEQNVREDGVKEEIESEKKRKSFFSNIKDRFVKKQDKIGSKITPIKEAGKDIKQGATDFFSNPLVLAGLLALIAPKEILGFLKGFLGELFFGEDANGFVQSFGAFLAIWTSFKFIKPIMGLVKMITGVFNIAKFFFMNPALLLIIGLITGAAYFIRDFRQKYGKRIERKQAEDELKSLQEDLNLEKNPEKRKIIQEQIEAKKAQIEEFSKQGVFSTPQQARKYSLEQKEKALGTLKGDLKGIAKNVILWEEINSTPPDERQKKFKPNDLQFFNEFKSSDDIIRTYAPNAFNEVKAAVNEYLTKPTVQATSEPTPAPEAVPESKPSPATTAPAPVELAPSTENDKNAQIKAAEKKVATMERRLAVAEADPKFADPEVQRQRLAEAEAELAALKKATPATQSTQAIQATSAESTTPPSISSELGQKKEEVARIEESIPSTGTEINETSAAVEAQYDQTPENNVITASADSTNVPKAATTIDLIPAIFANRSAFSIYEIFETPASVFPTSG